MLNWALLQDNLSYAHAVHSLTFQVNDAHWQQTLQDAQPGHLASPLQTGTRDLHSSLQLPAPKLFIEIAHI